MKKLEMILRPECIDEVKAALAAVGIRGMTVTEAIGAGNQKGRSHVYRGSAYSLELLPKIRVEVIVDDSEVDRVVDAVCKAAYTGEVGDGKIFISPIEEVIRVRTRERGVAAL